jgi:hypothetical protein
VAEEERWRDALRLYVAITRARDQVFLVYTGDPSEFLLRMKDQILWQEADLLCDYETDPAAAEEGRKPFGLSDEKVKRIKRLCADAKNESCRAWFDKTQLATLQTYFLKFVSQKRVIDTVQFSDWLTPAYLQKIRWKELLTLLRENPEKARLLADTFKKHGLDNSA